MESETVSSSPGPPDGFQRNYKVGEQVFVVDTVGNLEKAKIDQVESDQIHVHYGRYPKYGEWIKLISDRLRDEYGRPVNSLPAQTAPAPKKVAVNVPIPNEQDITLLKDHFREGKLTSEQFNENLDRLFQQSVTIRKAYDEMCHKKAQWKDHCKKLDTDLRMLQENNMQMVTDMNRLQQQLKHSQSSLAEKNSRIAQILNGSTAGAPPTHALSNMACDIQPITSEFPLVTDIRAQFIDFYNQRRLDLMESLDDHSDAKKLKLSERDWRDVVLRAWGTATDACSVHSSNFRSRVSETLVFDSSKEQGKARRSQDRFLTDYMQLNHTNRAIFDLVQVENRVLHQIVYLEDASAKVRRLISELVWLCWLCVLSEPRVGIFIPSPDQKFNKDDHERFAASDPASERIMEVVWPGLKYKDELIVKPKVKT